MSLRKNRHRRERETVQAPDRESFFEKIADYVSAAMGRPANIIVWLILVLAWTFIFAFGGKHLASGTWMPAWFTSTGFNFPMNLITTVCELFIGFLVAAASNRSERNLDRTLAAIAAQGVKVQETEDRLAAVDAENGALLRQNTELTEEVHAMATQQAELLRQQGELLGQVRTLMAQAVSSPPATAAGATDADAEAVRVKNSAAEVKTAQTTRPKRGNGGTRM
jgi:low affinity Fe/Cu permease